jgi:Protein of unknown function (DUF1573)
LVASSGQRPLQGASGKQPKRGQEQALRKRVEEYYGLLQLGRLGQAEVYVAADSRETFRKVPRSPFLGFRVISVALSPDGMSGVVIVQVRAYLGGLSPNPVETPYTTHWRLVDGRWYLELPKRIPASPLAAISQESRSPRSRRPEELKFKGHRYNLAKIEQDQKKVARFPFTNVTDHVVTIAAVITGNPLLTVEDYKKQYKPGESGELAIQLAPVGIERDFAQTVVVKTNPGGVITFLTVTAFVMPQAHDYPKGGVRNRPVAAPQPH